MAKYKHTTILRLCSPPLPSDMTLDVYTDEQKRTPIIQTHMLMVMPFRKGIPIPGELIPIRPPLCIMKANDCDCIHIGTVVTSVSQVRDIQTTQPKQIHMYPPHKHDSHWINALIQKCIATLTHTIEMLSLAIFKYTDAYFCSDHI